MPPGFKAPRELDVDVMSGQFAGEANLGNMEGSATHEYYVTPRFSPRHQHAQSDEGPSHIHQPRGGYLTQVEFNRRASQIEKRFATVEQQISKEIDSVRSYCGVIEKKIDTVIELLQNANMSSGSRHQSRYEHHNGFEHRGGSEHHKSFERQSAYEHEVGLEHNRPSTPMFDNPFLIKKQKLYPSMYSDKNGSGRLRGCQRLCSAKDSSRKAWEKTDSESSSSDSQGTLI
ncbi:Hypothetical predicted protein [Olea europaea subsp. europaea]|uniref:Uncharacterized protein n=1 Tax=Olea europaea subsp. europaea TaxID=158383 RepID=A0A8S0U9P4_OLEEU|nr:Hypothetical predicted protein [Olea europaea subsp. europaea]